MTRYIRLILRFYDKFRVLGTVVHEIAHAITIMLCGGKITQLDITSHVSHRGRYSLVQQILISYAPLVVNTLLAAYLAVWAVGVAASGTPEWISGLFRGVVPTLLITTVIESATLLLAFFIGAAALPSFQDAQNPYGTFAHGLKHPTLIRLITIPIALVVLAIFILPLIFTFIRSRNFWLHYLSEITFSLLVLVQATGLLVIIDFGLLIEQAVDHIVRPFPGW